MAITKLKRVDVVVVGVGVAGSIICKELAETGLQVVGLERGRMVDSEREFAMPYAHDEFKYERHSDILQNLSRETVTFRNAINETALPMRELGSFKPGECVGGAGVHWGGQSARFLPWDFETRSRTEARYGKQQFPEDCTSQDWGITFDELEPYYDQFEHLYGIGGKAGNLNGEIQDTGNRFEGPRTREFPNPPTQRTYAEAMFAEASQAMGYRPFSVATAGMTQPYTNPYKLLLAQCVRGGFCSPFGCAMGAKGTPLTTVVPALLKHENFELRPLCNVIKINLDSDKKRAVGVNYIDARGREVEQPADLVVLTSFVFSNTRLLLLSGIGTPYDPVSNVGAVGRNYAYQTVGSVKAFFNDKTFNPFMGGGGQGTMIDDFNGDNFDHSGVGFVGGGFLAVSGRGTQAIRGHSLPSGTPPWGSGWKKAIAESYNSSLSIATHAGCQSYRTHYLDLDPTYRDVHGQALLRLTFDWHDNEKRLSAYITSKAAEIAKAMHPAKLNASPVTGKYSIVPYQTTHNTGGAVMGSDPATSVVNKYLQSWDVSNLFVIGASAFPQNGANGPTCTVGALACWAADSIKDRYLKYPASLA